MELRSVADEALADISTVGRALVKVIQPNDVGATGSHQAGFHLPKPAWEFFSPYPPVDGENWSHPVEVTWASGTVTDSELKWWGVGTRSEFHLTRFNRIRNFPPRDLSNVGALLVLVPADVSAWRAYVVSSELDREALETTLGIDLALRSWATVGDGADRNHPASAQGDEEDKLLSLLKRMAQGMDGFPPGRVMADLAAEAVKAVLPALDMDEELMARLAAEFDLFKFLESRLHLPQIDEGFGSLDVFLSLAQTITQRRKARAGRSLELHFESMLRAGGLDFESQPLLDGTRPDFVFPSAAAYMSNSDGCIVLAVKTTCKDRWRQVLQEGPRVAEKHLLTTQRGISSAQLDEMEEARVQLVVPRDLHKDFAPRDRGRLLDVEAFAALLPRRVGEVISDPAGQV